jgi:phospho-N-acetylmuramoyl-pentapeptide-transferase
LPRQNLVTTHAPPHFSRILIEPVIMLPVLAPLLLARVPGATSSLAHLPLSTRALLAAALGLLLAIAAGPWCIVWLKRRFREPVKSASAEVARLHAAKRDTPTMGGIFIVACLAIVLLLVADFGNPFLPLALATTVALCAVGAADDWIKLRTARRGLTAKTKLAAQAAIALAAATLVTWLHLHVEGGTKLTVPWLGSFDIGWWFMPWAALVIVGSSNAVNLTDGLDGLAGGCFVCAGLAVAVLARVVGNPQWAEVCGVTHIPGASELAVVMAALVGCLLAFLWFNCHPAAVFMGDAGSLPLGGLLGLAAVILRQVMLLVLIAGVFVAEALSVIVQVLFFRWTRRRVFLCAPLHHHFQMRGWPEDKIVVRFWIASVLCAVAALATFLPVKLEIAADQLTLPAQTAGQRVEQSGETPTPVGQDPPTFAELF